MKLTPLFELVAAAPHRRTEVALNMNPKSVFHVLVVERGTIVFVFVSVAVLVEGAKGGAPK